MSVSLAGRTIFITGGSRGIGLAIAKRVAADGANVVLAAKTADPHPTLPGTIFTAAKEIEEAGGVALPLQVDIQDVEASARAFEKAKAQFGGIDCLVNNASAIDNSETLKLKSKKYDLMHTINARGTFMCSQLALQHGLLESDHAHVLNMSPPLAMDPKWFKMGGVAYTVAKYNMSMFALGMAEEYKGKVAFNCLWPRTAIATSAIDAIAGPLGRKACRSVDIMADTAHWILTQPPAACTGHTFVDEDIVKEHMPGKSLDSYRADTSMMAKLVPLMPDLFVGDPATMEKYVDTARSMGAFAGKTGIVKS